MGIKSGFFVLIRYNSKPLYEKVCIFAPHYTIIRISNKKKWNSKNLPVSCVSWCC